jgi:hypothetical protein
VLPGSAASKVRPCATFVASLKDSSHECHACKFASLERREHAWSVLKRRRRKLAEELKTQVEQGTTFADDPFPAPPAQEVLSWGRGIEEIYDPNLGPYAADAVYTLTKQALYFRYEASYENRWIERFDFSKDYEDAQTRQAVDGRWDLLLVPYGATEMTDAKGFGFVESYGGLSATSAADYAAIAARHRLKEVPPSIAARLSADSLGDVPERFRATSEDDAADWKVLRAAERGLAHTFLNVGVAYRVLFADRLREGEVAESFHRGHIEDRDDPLQPEQPETGLLLITNRGLLWHLTTDGIPGVGAVLEPEGERGLDFADIEGAAGKRMPEEGPDSPAKEVLAVKVNDLRRMYFFLLDASPLSRSSVDRVLERVPRSARNE